MDIVRTENGNFFCPDDPGESQYPGSPPRLSVTEQEAVEIGTGLGVSTRALASTAASVVTVDPDPWVVDPCLPNVRFLREAPDPAGFDMAFIDGLHERDAVVRDIERCKAIPLIVLHDTDLRGVREAIERTGLRRTEDFGTKCQMAAFTRS